MVGGTVWKGEVELIRRLTIVVGYIEWKNSRGRGWTDSSDMWEVDAAKSRFGAGGSGSPSESDGGPFFFLIYPRIQDGSKMWTVQSNIYERFTRTPFSYTKTAFLTKYGQQIYKCQSK